jgi:hypothetical protein
MSMMSPLPPGRSTRCISFSAPTGSEKILERRAADKEIEPVCREGHRGGIALAEFDVHGGTRGVLLGDAHEGMADVETRDAEGTQFRELDGKVARSWRDLEHESAWFEFGHDAAGFGAEFGECTGGVLRVPGRDRPFHSHPPVRLARICASDWHGHLPFISRTKIFIN